VFKKDGPNRIKSDEGFSVEILGIEGILYSEGTQRMHINSELIKRFDGIVVYSNSMRTWDPPHENEVIDANKKNQIIDNIRRAFQYKGYEIHVIELPTFDVSELGL